MPGRRADLRYFPAARLHDRDGVMLKVTPHTAASWIGVFAAEPKGRYKSGIYSCPDANALCVISNGAGYTVDVRDPDGYEELPIFPVLEVLPGKDPGLLIVVNYTDVLAWGLSGEQWCAERVSFDGIRDLRIEGRFLHGLAWSPMKGECPFTLDLATGARVSRSSQR